MTRRVCLPCRLQALAIVLTSTTLFFGAIALEAESLLACVTAGLIAANRRHATTARVMVRGETAHEAFEQLTGLDTRASNHVLGNSLPRPPRGFQNMRRSFRCSTTGNLQSQVGEARPM